MHASNPCTEYHCLANLTGRWILGTILIVVLKLGIEVDRVPPPFVKVSTMATIPFASICWFHLSFSRLLRQNLAVSDAKPTSSTQKLLRHLHQLDAAFAVLQEHATQNRGRTGQSPCATSPSGLVLLHAGHKYITDDPSRAG